jgi:biotin operon repressor
MSDERPCPDITYNDLLNELRERFPQLSTEGVSTTEIAREFGISQSTALSWLKSLANNGYTVGVVRKRIRSFNGVLTTIPSYVVERTET